MIRFKDSFLSSGNFARKYLISTAHLTFLTTLGPEFGSGIEGLKFSWPWKIFLNQELSTQNNDSYPKIHLIPDFGQGILIWVGNS